MGFFDLVSYVLFIILLLIGICFAFLVLVYMFFVLLKEIKKVRGDQDDL